MGKNCFVFVVCGEDEHILTLNFSLKYLKRFSKSEITVVTDLSRNGAEIEHDSVVDVETPKQFNHHQASIYLKTRLHKIVDPNQEYCYLDSDVIATNSKVDEIFDHKYGPVTFASDHCSLPEFSPNAMRCGCKEKSAEKVDLLNSLDQEFKEKFIPTDPDIYKNYMRILDVMREYDDQFTGIKKNPLVRFLLYHLQPGKYDFERYLKTNGNFRWDRDQKKAFDDKDNLIYDEYNKYSSYVEARSPFRWDNEQQLWFDENGVPVFKATCTHLKNRIGEQFNITITNPEWTHWNGGIFLFNEDSAPFMDAWHEKTMGIFEDEKWETRDQGTLAATVWEFGLQNQKRLPAEFNFLADYNRSALQFKEGSGFSLDDFQTVIHPNFLHIYHQFGNQEWDVWQYVESLIKQKSESV